MYTDVVSIYVPICVLDYSTTRLYWFSSMKSCVQWYAFDASPPWEDAHSPLGQTGLYSSSSSYWFSNPAHAIFTTNTHCMMTLHLPRSILMAYQKHRCQVPSSYWWLLLSCNAYARVTPEGYAYIPSWPNRLYISGLYIVRLIIIYAPCVAIGQRQRCKTFSPTESSFAVKIQTWSRCTEYYTPSSRTGRS